MGPWSAFSTRVAAALEEAGHTASVIAGLPNQVVPDAIVLRPEEPWISRGAEGQPARFGPAHLERYAAVCAVRVSDPPSSMESLYTMAMAVLEAGSDEGWNWASVSGISRDESTDTPLLVCVVRLTYTA